MALHPSEAAFLEDLALAKSSWLKTASSAVESEHPLIWSDQTAAWTRLRQLLAEAGATSEFVAVVDELLSGVLHSVLVTLDGGSHLAETTLIYVTDDKGHTFRRFLHEYWPEFNQSGA